jgi:hypothetical protein
MNKNLRYRLITLAAIFYVTPAISGDFKILPIPTDKRFPDYVYFSPSQALSWQNGIIYWKYNPANQPSASTTDQIVQILKVAQAKWEQVCGIRFEYQGTTSNGIAGDGVNVVKWEAVGGDFSGLTQNYMDATGHFIDTDVKFDPDKIPNPAFLEALATHEFGHALGLNHSDTQNSIMFANPYHTAGYQMILRTDDVNGCQSLYGSSNSLRSAMPVNYYFDRLFNFAEDYAPSFLNPRKQGDTQYDPTYNAVYRAYPNTSSYLAIYQGNILYNGPATNYQWENQGPVELWMPYTANAGYF